MRFLICLGLALASSCVIADELRLPGVTYPGTVDAISPPYGLDSAVLRFRASGPGIPHALPRPSIGNAPTGSPWQIILTFDDGTYITLACTGTVPGYLGSFFAFDVSGCKLLP